MCWTPIDRAFFFAKSISDFRTNCDETVMAMKFSGFIFFAAASRNALSAPPEKASAKEGNSVNLF